MKFSYVMLPDYPLEESLRAIKLADELGFYGCYAADETWHKDLWLLFAAAARDTTNIRFGPSLSGVVLREPTLIAQAAATLDELTNGRAEVVLGSGNFGLLAQYKHRLGADQAAVPGQGGRPGHPDLARRRCHHLRRRVLQVQGTLHVRAAGPGAVARQDRVHAWPEVVRGRR